MGRRHVAVCYTQLDVYKRQEKKFDEKFWKGEYYSSSEVVDDRANALAVLSGLCGKEKHGLIRKILIKVFNASVYMENYALLALCEMGYFCLLYTSRCV